MSNTGWTSKNTIIAFVITVIGGALGTLLYDFIKKIPILSTIGYIFSFIGDCISWIWHGIIYLLTIDLQVWWILVVIIFISIISRIKTNIRNKQEAEVELDPTLLYNVDTFGINNAKWTWNYKPNSNTIHNMAPLCPVCESPMSIHDGYAAMGQTGICSDCRLHSKPHSFSLQQHSDDVMNAIIKRLNSGEWKNRLSKA